MIEVKLEREEWQRVLSFLSQQPWFQVNVLMLKIAGQVEMDQPGRMVQPRPDGAQVKQQ